MRKRKYCWAHGGWLALPRIVTIPAFVHVSQGELVEVGLSMKAPLEKVADNLPPPMRPTPLTSADQRRSGYGGLGTRWTSWEELSVRSNPWAAARAMVTLESRERIGV